MDRLEPFVGTWRIEAPFPVPQNSDATTTFEWTLGRTFLLQRSDIPVPAAPDALVLYGTDRDLDYVQHYFDDRGVTRIYRMTFDGRHWTLQRDAPDFTELPFHQRWVGEFSEDGHRIDGRWETSPDGAAWELDFPLHYLRL